MKKTFTCTIIVLIVLSLITAGQVLAQDILEEEMNRDLKDAQIQKEAEFTRKEAEVAQKNAEIEAKIAEQQAKTAQEQMRITKNMLEDTRASRITIPRLQHSGSGGVLVIPAAEMKVENLALVTEDMSVMSRIFDKKISQSNVQMTRGRLYGDFNPFFGHSNRTTETIYLEGYGALFLMKVNMLLSAPPEAQQKEKAEEEDTDPVWAEMKRQMYEPEDVRRSRTDDRPEEKYDAEKVESLKTNLIKTLKHATNIRALKSDQLVILTVIGDGGRSGATITRSYSYGRSTGSRTGSRRNVQTAPGNGTASLMPTVLTICAKKSDIDAFAKGQIDYEQFRKRTGIFKSYAKAGQQASPGSEVHQVAHEVHDAF